MRVHAQVLGQPSLEVDGRRHDPAPSKRAALLYYLVWRDAWASRDEVGALLWGDRSDRSARGNLRQALFRLRGTPLGSALEVESERLRFRGDSDLARVRSALRERDAAAALRACAGAFLDGWRLPRAPQADAWIERTRSDIAAAMRRATSRRAAELEASGDLIEAADLYGATWRENVLDESAIAAQLRLLRHAGRADDAARTASAYRAAFVDAMDMEPDGSLGELLTDAERAPRVGMRAAAPDPRASERLPCPATSFIGRTRELGSLRTWLASPSSRLVTLVGLGGVGKTRLALEAVRSAAADGTAVAWAPLEALDADDEVPAALAAGWGLAEPGTTTLDALADRIGARRAVLAIDNAEHVAGGVREAVDGLLAACPGLRVLVTSRTALGTASERRLVVDGLSCDPSENASDAARLFVERARAVDPTFAEDADRATVEAIAREVGGSPLGLELLASWADVYGPAEMLAEVRSGLDLVASDDAPDRQRGLGAVLDSTVERLPSPARRAYLRLAPFRGGVALAAARAVGVEPTALRDLARSALLRREGTRYVRHPLVQRHARERAERDPALWKEVRARHGEHFLRRLTAAEGALLRKAGTRAAGEMMRDDVANVREALLWAVRHAPPLAFLRAYQLFVLLEKSFRLARDLELTRELAARSEGPLRAHLRVMEGTLGGRAAFADGLEAADREARELIEIGRASGDVVLEGRLLTRRGTIRIRSGDPSAALRHLRQAARLLRRRAAGWAGMEQLFHAHAYSVTSVAQRRRGRYLAARHDLLRALAIVRGIGDAGLEELGDLVRLDLLYGRFDAALRAAVAARRCLPDDAPPTAAIDVLGDEARVRIATGDLPGARRLAERRLAAAEGLYGDLRRDRVAASHSLSGYLALVEGDLDRAGDHLARTGGHHVDLTRRARLALARREAAEALRLADDALVSLDRLGAPPDRPFELALARAARAEALLMRDGVATAAPYVVEMLPSAAATEIPQVIARALLPSARLLADRGDALAHVVARALGEHPRVEFEVRRSARDLAAACAESAGRPADDRLRSATVAALDALTRS